MSIHTSNYPVASLNAGRSRSLEFAQRAGLALAASVFVAVCSHIAVPLPFTPVPFTLQPFAVLLVGMLLGPGTAFAALMLYLCEGAAGLPVFAPGLLTGIARLLGPTAGYLFAYPVVAAIAGGMPRALEALPITTTKTLPRFAALAIAGAVATLVLYASGSLWFSHLLALPLRSALAAAVLPFAASDAVKVLAAAGIASALQARRA